MSLTVNPDRPVIFYACVPKDWNTTSYPADVAKRWLEILDTPVIPFAPEKRHVLELRAAPVLRELLHIRRERERAQRPRGQSAEDEPSLKGNSDPQ
jgi:hypothetical protein